MSLPTNDDYIRSALPRYGRVPRGLLRDANVAHGAVRLYGLLDDYAGQDGQAFPKRATIADSFGVSVDTVDRWTRALVDGEWLVRVPRRRDDGSQTSNLYLLTAGPTGAATMRPPTRTSAATPAAPVRLLEGDPLEGVTTPPTPRKRGERRATVVADNDPGWSLFWNTYPRKVGKGAARKAYAKALRVTDAATLQLGAQRVAAELADRKRKPRPDDRGTDPTTFVPHPTTWLNREGWSDEAEQLAPVDGAAARPQAWRRGMPECVDHPGQHADRCPACASERLAGDR